jgi:HEAT repeat protein
MDRSAALQKLRSVMYDENVSPRFRQWAVFEIGRFKAEASEVVADLLRMLKANDPERRLAAAGVLGQLGQGKREVISALLDALNDPHPSVRGSAAFALGQLRDEPQRCLPAIHQTLQREIQQRRNDRRALSGILRGLLQFGPDAKASIALVFDVAKDANMDRIIRTQAVQCLIAIGPSARKQLEAMAADQDWLIARMAKLAAAKVPAAEPIPKKH